VTNDDDPLLPPIGWQTAVAMLRTGIRRVSVLHGLQAELGLSPQDAADALAFGTEWLREARTP
jgi:hypothetical protein